MNAFEFAELSAAAMGNFLATFSVFLSVATAYLVAAYLVGRKLTTLQLSIVNGCYLISSSILGYLVAANFRVFYIWSSSNIEGTIRQSADRPALIDFTWPLTTLLVVIVLGSLTFMYSIRRGDSDDLGT